MHNLVLSIYVPFFLRENVIYMSSLHAYSAEMCEESQEWWNWAEALHRAILRLLVMRRQMCKYNLYIV